MTNIDLSPLEKLRIAAPDTYAWVCRRVTMLGAPADAKALALLADATIWGLSQEPGLGEAVAKGLLDLMPDADATLIEDYLARVHQAAGIGATQGRLEALFWGPVLLAGDQMVAAFERALAVMLAKGTYTLSAPLEMVVALLTAREEAAARSYLELLAATFRQEMTYNQSLRMVYLLPKAVRFFPPQRRRAQIDQLNRLVRVDINLVEPFLDGLEKGSGLLDPEALTRFVTLGLEKHSFSTDAGLKFFGLTSQLGQDACAALQRAVPLTQVRGAIRRYLQARMGWDVPVQSLSGLGESDTGTPWVASDGRCLYLPDEMDYFNNPADNRSLYKALSRLEAGYFECRTFDFDIERAADNYPIVAQWLADNPPFDATDLSCDGERFIGGFSNDRLAADLFTLYEQARVVSVLSRSYPGLVRRVLPLLQKEQFPTATRRWEHLLVPVYAKLVLTLPVSLSKEAMAADLQRHLIALFEEQPDGPNQVEASAALVISAYDRVDRFLRRARLPYTPLKMPFHKGIRWDWVSRAFAAQERAVMRIKLRLDGNDLAVYRSDLRNRMVEQQGELDAADIEDLVLSRSRAEGKTQVSKIKIHVDLEQLLKNTMVAYDVTNTHNDGATVYPEWDCHLQDYLHRHVHVREVELLGGQDGGFYHQVLARHQGMVAHIRRAFEMLKPEGLTILRQWPEGDAFDYRALLDFAIDRRAGRIPSDRLFIKRLKQERDVAVLLLVDMSRSTANPVAGRRTTVLGVAKEALVLFCEALQVVGDAYAMAGFSGSGRYAVDYFRIKDFEETLADEVRMRLSSLSPQRSTRMGAAIRHATHQLARVRSRVRLLIVVSDGFPNDLGYKSDYAIVDTRRAVQEARSKGCHVKAITVNIGSDPRLDELYGRFHHHVINDVRELPDKLLRVYGTLTRL